MYNMKYKSKNGYMGVIYGNGRHVNIYAPDNSIAFSIHSSVPTEKISAEALHALVDNYPGHQNSLLKIMEDLRQ